MKHKFIEDKTFNTYIYFCYDCSEEEFISYVNRKYNQSFEILQCLGKTTILEKPNTNVVRVLVWVNKINNYETIAHELIHAIRYWLQDYQNINLNSKTEEIYTLLHSFYMREILKIKKIK